jgi:hypothetical protein
MQISLADSFFSHGMYHEARVEYLREFFFDPDLYNNENKRMRFALATLKVDTTRGIREMVELVHDMPEMNSDSKLRIAQQYMSLGYTEYARIVLSGTDSTRMYGYTYLQEGNLTGAREYFLRINDTTIVNDIDRYLDMPRPSLRTATILSLVCPGAGEIYAGNVASGIKNFILNAGSIFLIYNAMRQKKYVDAVLVFNFLFHRFYIGSIYNTQKTVLNYHEHDYEVWMQHMRSTYPLDTGHDH